jgi:hypothetical protein
VLRVLVGTRPWREGSFRSILRVWVPACALCILVATALTASLQLRWWFLSGPLGGIIASLWVAYYLDRALQKRSAAPPREDWERRMAGRLSGLELSGWDCPLTVVLTSDQAREDSGRPGAGFPPAGENRLVWRNALRGKLLLDRENAKRLASLLFPRDAYGMPRKG